MTSVFTKKKPLTGWVSPEIYQQVLQLCSGEDSPYKSISEYVTTLVNRDLAVREHKSEVSEPQTQYAHTQTLDITAALIEALNRPEVVAKLKDTLQK